MPWHAALAGLAASLVGIGLARFAYTPLIPALIGAHWFSPATVVYFGAANLAGYLAGAVLARRLAGRFPAPAVLNATMLVASLSFFASAAPVSVIWYFLWRFASGVVGGIIMVLAAPTVLPAVDPARRGLVSGLIFTGVGLGVGASGTLVPLLLHAGLAATWCGLGAVSCVLTAVAWGGWPSDASAPAASLPAAAPRIGALLSLPVCAMLFEYGLNAFGLVPHMVFLVDFIARGLGWGLTVGSAYWVVFGLGAMAGPLLAGTVADRIGFAATLRLGLAIEAAAVSLPAVTAGPVWLALSAAVAGAAAPGIVPVVLGRVRDLLPGDEAAQRIVWSWTTIAFALFQAGGAYLDSFLFARGGAYATLFALGAAALAFALTIDLAVGLRQKLGRIAA
jgi:predicted MFS family arabinose efflux permease